MLPDHHLIKIAKELERWLSVLNIPLRHGGGCIRPDAPIKRRGEAICSKNIYLSKTNSSEIRFHTKVSYKVPVKSCRTHSKIKTNVFDLIILTWKYYQIFQPSHTNNIY